jgi:hypothetical protein
MRAWMSLTSVVILLTTSCGYNFVGMGSGLPKDIQKIEIPLFVNKTSHARMENTFTNSLIREFNQRKQLNVVQDKDADAVILGIIKAMRDFPLSYSGARTVIENRLTLILDVTLQRKDNDEILWRDPNLSHYQVYSVSTNITVSEQNKELAILRIAEVLSQRIHNRIFESF